VDLLFALLACFEIAFADVARSGQLNSHRKLSADLTENKRPVKTNARAGWHHVAMAPPAFAEVSSLAEAEQRRLLNLSAPTDRLK
jgi:hypothetical protein